ncbi:MAG: hypothetical protein Q7S19_00365 [bacterium]|nr:hypothetical protein [bacterium]
MYRPKRIPLWSGREPPNFKKIEEFETFIEALEGLDGEWRSKQRMGEIPEDRRWAILKLLFDDYALFVAVDPVLKSNHADMLVVKVRYENIQDEHSEIVEEIPEAEPQDNPLPPSNVN